MGCFPFANFHFQMGVTVMGFAEDSAHSDLKPLNWRILLYNIHTIQLMIFVTILHDTFSHKDDLIDVACV